MTMRVKDVMGAEAITVEADATFADIVATMQRFEVGAVAVVDADRRVRGMIAEDDLLLKETAAARPVPILAGPRRRDEHRKAAGGTAAQIMSAPALTVTPGTPVREAACLMHDTGIKQLPVIDPVTGRIIGTVHQRDLLRVFTRPEPELRADIADVLRRRAGIDPRTLSIRIRDGVATISGTARRRSQAARLTEAVTGVEGIVAAHLDLRYELDDLVTASGAPPLL
jgi:CBS-domain-containing membrane protein